MPTSVPYVGRSVTDEQLIAAIKAAHGMIATTARALKMHRSTIHRRAQNNPDVADAIKESREVSLDKAELKLFDAVERGEPWAVCFFLKCQGKERGYIEKFDVKQDITHRGKVEVDMQDLRDKLSSRLRDLGSRMSVVPDEPFHE